MGAGRSVALGRAAFGPRRSLILPLCVAISLAAGGGLVPGVGGTPAVGQIAGGYRPSAVSRAMNPVTFRKILTGRNESHRLELVRRLVTDVETRSRANDEIVDGLRVWLDMAVSRDPLPPSVAESVRLLARMRGRGSDELLLETLGHDRLELAMLTADALGASRRLEFLGHLAQSREDPRYAVNYGFRFNLVRSLLRMRHPDAYEVLGRWERQLDGQLGHELGQQLDEVVREDFHGDDERFLAWKRQTGRAEDESRIRLASDSGSQAGIRLAPSHYYGIPIHAKRIAFVIDCSGSMNVPAYGGTRIGHAKRELVRAIGELPETAEFTVIAFHEQVFRWKADLVPASPENRAKAMRYVAALATMKSTNTYGALREAMGVSDDMEAIFLVSDGEPNRGEIRSPPLIVRDISARNEYRNLVIHSVGVAVSGPTQEFMRQLAENNAGEFRAID